MDNNLERDVSAKSVLKFTFSSIIMMIIMALYTIIDGVFVSRLIGTDAFSAVNIVFPLLGLIIGIATMFGSGLAAIVSIKLGQGEKRKANEIFSFTIAFTVLIGILISSICLIFIHDIIYALGSNDEIYQYCYEYGLPIIFFFTASILQLQFQMIYIVDGKPHIGLILTIIGGVSNVILDYVLISKFNLGISGASIATGIGYSIPAIYGILYFSLNRKGNIFFVKAKMNFKELLSVMANGSSEMVTNLSSSVTTFLFNIIMMKLVGQDGVAAISILLYLDFILMAISLGYSMGVAPLISYNYGCGDRVKIRKIYKLSINFSMLVGLLMTLLTFVFSEQLAGIFSERGTGTYELAKVGLKIYAFGYLFKCYNIFSATMFTAFGNGKISALLAFMRTLVFLVVCLISLSAIFGVTGVWYSSPVSEILSLILSVFFVLKYGKIYGYTD